MWRFDLENYTKIRMITDKYKNKGANKGDTGAIIEVYINNNCPNNYMVELFDPKTGVTKTIINVVEGDIEPLENYF
jgi:hypothetical protein